MSDEPRNDDIDQTGAPSPGNRSPRQIENEIEHTRAQLADTIGEIENKLTPGEIAREAGTAIADKTRDMATRTGRRIRRTLMDNPLPYALIAAGAAWLLIDKRRSNRYDYDHGYEGAWRNEPWSDRQVGAGRMRERAGELKEKVSERAHQASEQIRERAHDATDRVREVGMMARERSYQARDQFDRVLHEQPILVAGLGFALGAALGAILPSTEFEDRQLGSARDSVMEKAAELGERGLDKAGQAVETAGQKAEQATQRTQQGQQQGGQPPPSGQRPS